MKKQIAIIGLSIIMTLTSGTVTSWAVNYEDAADSVLIHGGRKYYLDEEGRLMNTDIPLPEGFYLNENGQLIDGNKYPNDVTMSDNPNTQDLSQYPLSGYREVLHLTESDINVNRGVDYSIMSDDYDKWDFYNNLFMYGGDSSAWVYVYLLSGEKPTGYNKEMRSAYRNEMVQQVAEVLRNFLNSFDWKNASDYEKACKALELCCQAKYDWNTATGVSREKWLKENAVQYEDGGWGIEKEDLMFTDAQYNRAYHMPGCLVDKLCVCQGYAETYVTLCRLIGLEAFMAEEADCAHAWSYVKIDGVWYTVDATNASAEYSISYWLGKPAMEQEDVQFKSYN